MLKIVVRVDPMVQREAAESLIADADRVIGHPVIEDGTYELAALIPARAFDRVVGEMLALGADVIEADIAEEAA